MTNQSQECMFSDWGIDILKRNEKFYVRFDAGGISSEFVEREISSEDASRAMISEDEAYLVIRAAQNRHFGW